MGFQLQHLIRRLQAISKSKTRGSSFSCFKAHPIHILENELKETSTSSSCNHEVATSNADTPNQTFHAYDTPIDQTCKDNQTHCKADMTPYQTPICLQKHHNFPSSFSSPFPLSSHPI